MMSRTCCGYEQTTKFCAHCGTPLSGHNLSTLLSYCTSQRRMKEVQLGKAMKKKGTKAGDKTIRNLQAALNKWKDWSEGLQRTLYPPAEQEAVAPADVESSEEAAEVEESPKVPWAS